MNATRDYTSGTESSATDQARNRPAYEPLSRPAEGQVLVGVAAGVARSLGVDPLIVRLAFVALTLLGGAGVPLYLAGWLLIPDERSGQSLAAEAFQSLSARHN